jgi:hypothetical protein
MGFLFYFCCFPGAAAWDVRRGGIMPEIDPARKAALIVSS